MQFKFLQSSWLGILLSMSVLSCSDPGLRDIQNKEAENILFPKEAKAIIDMTQPPYNLDPTGKEDCSEAMIRALDDMLRPTRDRQKLIERLTRLNPDTVIGFEINGRKGVIFPDRLEPSRIFYFPNGTYRISKTVEYTLTDLQNTRGAEINRQIHFQGQSEKGTVFKLDDHATGFDGDTIRPVISYMKGRHSNIAMSNTFENITIDIGTGNPGAIGLHFFANNTGAVRNVTIRSSDPDGQGAIGLAILKDPVSGCLFKNITVIGFDYGIKVQEYGIFTVFEHINLNAQRKAGFWIVDNVVSLRALSSVNNVPAVLLNGDYGVLCMIDSELKGNNEKIPAIDIRSGMAFIRNVNTSGYGQAMKSYTTGNVSASRIDEFHSHPPISLFGKNSLRSLDMPVEETPALPWHGNMEDWACVDAYGASGLDKKDDTKAIQLAMNSGKKVVWFQPGKYVIDSTIVVPSTVERVNFMYSDLIAGEQIKEMENSGAFKVVGDSELPLVMEDLFAWEAWLGSHYLIEHAGTRTLVIRDIHTQVGSQYFNSVEGGKVFIENVCTTDEYPKRKCYVFNRQKVWARQINPERSDPEVVNNGGDLWILGFKTESNGISFQTLNGGRTEVLGGVVNCYGKNMLPDIPMFSILDSEVSIFSATRGPDDDQRKFTLIVDEEQKDEKRQLMIDELPVRRGNNIFIPMYISRNN